MDQLVGGLADFESRSAVAASRPTASAAPASDSRPAPSALAPAEPIRSFSAWVTGRPPRPLHPKRRQVPPWNRLLLEETRNALSCILRHRQGPLLGFAGHRTCLILAVAQLAAPDLDGRLKLVLGRCVSVGGGLARLVDGPCDALADGAGGLVHRARGRPAAPDTASFTTPEAAEAALEAADAVPEAAEATPDAALRAASAPTPAAPFSAESAAPMTSLPVVRVSSMEGLRRSAVPAPGWRAPVPPASWPGTARCP